MGLNYQNWVPYMLACLKRPGDLFVDGESHRVVAGN